MGDLKKDAEDNKFMGVLAYLGILVIIPILAAKESPFAKFHSNQGLILCIVWVALWFVGFILAFLPIIGWLISLALYIGCFVFMILGIINALNGEMKELPVIGKFTILK